MVQTEAPRLTEEQQKAVDILDRNVAVSAGAGSGKTQVLTRRFIHILETGLTDAGKRISTHQILAITFTEKAAAEIRDRIRQLLQEQFQKARSPEESGFWRDRLQELPQAQIGTIHSLCSSILRMNPLESGVDPAFRILTNPDLERFLAESTQDFLRMELAGNRKEPDYHPEQLAAEYGVSNLTDFLTDWFADGDMPDETDWEKSLGEAQGREKEVCLAWKKLLARFHAYMVRQKRDLHVLTFNDLEREAVRLLDGNKALCRRYARKYRYIMVDEFQDTNPWQKALIYLLAGGRKDKLEGNRLFVVGDAKQSIYRFRGADVSVFAKVQQDIVDPEDPEEESQRPDKRRQGERISLAVNFRSGAPILRFCNTFFREVFGRPAGEGETAIPFEEQLLPAARGGKETEPFLSQIPQLFWVKGMESLGAQLCEAGIIARELKKLHEEEHIPYEKMAILMRKMTNSGLLVETLRDAGVPVNVVDGRNFYDRQDVRDLMNLFFFVVDPLADEPLLGLLRSPYFAVDDEILTALCLDSRDYRRDGGCLWSFLNKELAGGICRDDRLAAAVPKLTRLQAGAMLLNLPQFLELMERALQPERVLAAQENGVEKLANYWKFRSLAFAFAEEQGGAVAEYADRLRFLRDNYKKEASATAAAEDAVSVMTIHKSKGLEFPVVVIPFLESGDKPEYIIAAYQHGKGFGFKYKADPFAKDMKETGLLTTLGEMEKAQKNAEKDRLLYVAMTRAEKRLILIGYVRMKNENDLYSTQPRWVAQLHGSDNTAKAWQDGGEPVARVEEKDLEVWEQELKAERSATAGTAADAAPAASRPPEAALAPLPGYEETAVTEFTPSSLQDYEYCQRQYYYKNIARIVPLEEDAAGAAAAPETGHAATALKPVDLGHVVHRTLELIARARMDGHEPDEAERRELYRQAVLESVPGDSFPDKLAASEAAGVPEMLRQYLAGSLYQSFAGRQVLAEYPIRLPFFSEKGHTFYVTGVMDAVAERADGNVEIVDYKTGTPPREDGDAALKPGYAYQLALYWFAADTLLQQAARKNGDAAAPLKVAKASLHYIRTAREVALDSAEKKDAWLDEARRLCREIYAKRTEQDFRRTDTERACLHCPFRYMCRES